MENYKVELKPSAEKELNKLEPNYIKRILEKIKDLAESPQSSNSRKLKKMSGYRIRVGSYRIIYDIDFNERLISIFRIRHRKDVYENK